MSPEHRSGNFSALLHLLHGESAAIRPSGPHGLMNEGAYAAEDTIADVNASGLWPGRVVTEVGPASAFCEAEPEHQDYLEHYPNGYTCHFARPQWKLPRRAAA